MRRLAILALLAPLALGAQSPADTAKPLVSARAWFRDSTYLWRRTELLAPVGDTVVVRGTFELSGALVTYRVPVASVARLEHYVLRSRRDGMKRGAKLGALLGFAAGAIITGPFIGARDPDAPDTRIGELVFVVGTTMMTLAGTTAGILLGAGSPGGTWACVPNAPCEPRHWSEKD